MSVSLVKKSLQLIESSGFRGNKNNVKKNSSKPLKIEKLHQRSKVNKNHKNRNILKTFQKLQKQLKENRDQDKTEENLKRLKVVGEGTKLGSTEAVELFKRATKSKEVKIETVEEVQSTVFTEEDFAKFEREYAFE